MERRVINEYPTDNTDEIVMPHVHELLPTVEMGLRTQIMRHVTMDKIMEHQDTAINLVMEQ